MLLSLALLASPLAASETREIDLLKKQVIDVANAKDSALRHSEFLYNHRLATLQVNLLIKTLSYETWLYLRKQGVHRSPQDIEAIVSASYACSWTFTALGNDHLDRFINIIQWPRDETGFQPKMICHWKAGTYIESIHKTVLKNTIDYGAYQINEMHIKPLRNIDKLYNSGIVGIKVKHIRSYKDLLDINTNCVARCVIETDRKSRGWEWHHIGDRVFHKMIVDQIGELEAEHLYNRHFIEKYYFLTPRKKYSPSNFSAF